MKCAVTANRVLNKSFRTKIHTRTDVLNTTTTLGFFYFGQTRITNKNVRANNLQCPESNRIHRHTAVNVLCRNRIAIYNTNERTGQIIITMSGSLSPTSSDVSK